MSALEVDVAGHVGVGVGALTVAAAFRTNDAPLVVVGPNGAGKTSLLMMILGAATPTRGRVSLAGATLYDRDAGVDVPVERRGIGFLPQRYALFPHLDALHNVAYGIAAPSRADRLDRAREALRELDVAPLAERRPAELSGGEAQRVAHARALARQPRALVLDEPLAALDVGLRERILPYLLRVRDEWKTPVLYVTHNVGEALALSSRVLLLRAGRVEAVGAPFDLLGSAGMANATEAGLENLFSGRVRAHDVEGGVTIVDVPTRQSLTVPLAPERDPGSEVTVAVRAEDVIVARRAPEGLSARNLFEVRIAAIARAGADVTLRCSPAISQPTPEWIVRVTPSAAASLGLSVGQTVFLAVKSHSFRLL